MLSARRSKAARRQCDRGGKSQVGVAAPEDRDESVVLGIADERDTTRANADALQAECSAAHRTENAPRASNRTVASGRRKSARARMGTPEGGHVNGGSRRLLASDLVHHVDGVRQGDQPGNVLSAQKQNHDLLQIPRVDVPGAHLRKRRRVGSTVHPLQPLAMDHTERLVPQGDDRHLLCDRLQQLKLKLLPRPSL